MAEILAIGELLTEFMAERIGQTFAEPGIFAGPYPSGAPAIFADQAAKTGAAVAFIGCVGDDGFGDLIVNRLREDRVDVSSIARSDTLPTGTAFVSYRTNGDRDFIFNMANSAAAQIDAGSVRPESLRGTKYLHVMGSSLGSAGMIAALMRAIELTRENGGKVSFDPNIRREILASATARNAVESVLRECDVLLPSEADLHHFYGDVSQVEAVSRLFSAHRVQMIVVKSAERGCAYYDRDKSLRVPAFRIEQLDPTGAGDCFGGTLISCLVQGIELERALTLANAAGALAVAKRGPMEGNSTMDELQRFIASAQRHE
jgi:sugar/nucleoside kinase (ribokinase family)